MCRVNKERGEKGGDEGRGQAVDLVLLLYYVMMDWRWREGIERGRKKGDCMKDGEREGGAYCFCGKLMRSI